MGGQRHAAAPLPLGKTRYPLYRRLGGLQGWSRRVQKITPPPGFNPWTVQTAVSCYTDWATLAHLYALAPTKKRMHGPHTWPEHTGPASSQGPNHPACKPITQPTTLCHLPLLAHSMEQGSSSENHSPYLVKEFPHFIETICCFSTNKYKFWYVMSIKNMDLWDALPCEWVQLYKCFAGTCCLHLQGRNAPLKMERTFLSKMLLLIYTTALCRKKHNLEADACHMVMINCTITPISARYHSISHFCCGMSFIQLIIIPSNTWHKRKQPYLSKLIICRLSQCSLSSCSH